MATTNFEWTPLHMDYITHYGDSSSFRRATVCVVGSKYELSKWYKGCGFSPDTEWFDTMQDAKLAGELWVTSK